MDRPHRGQYWPRDNTPSCLSRAGLQVSALARLDKTEWTGGAMVGVPVTVRDGTGSEVARAVVSFAVAVRTN